MRGKKGTTTPRAPVGDGRGTLKSSTMRIEVIKAHDGIKKGEILVKSKETAKKMIEKGFYKEVFE